MFSNPLMKGRRTRYQYTRYDNKKNKVSVCVRHGKPSKGRLATKRGAMRFAKGRTKRTPALERTEGGRGGVRFELSCVSNKSSNLEPGIIRHPESKVVEVDKIISRVTTALGVRWTCFLSYFLHIFFWFALLGLVCERDKKRYP